MTGAIYKEGFVSYQSYLLCVDRQYIFKRSEAYYLITKQMIDQYPGVFPLVTDIFVPYYQSLNGVYDN